MKLVVALLALCLTVPAVAHAQVFRGDSFGKRRTSAAKVSKAPAERRPRPPAKAVAKKTPTKAKAKAKAPEKDQSVTVVIEDQ